MSKDDALPSITDFRPAAETTDAIGEAFDRLTTARVTNLTEIERMRALRPELLRSAPANLIEKNDTSIRRREILTEQFALYEPELRVMFDAALMREQDEEYAAAAAAAGTVAEAFAAEFREHYPRHAAAIAALLRKESEARAALNALVNLPGHSRSQAARPVLPRPSQGGSGIRSFGGCTTLLHFDGQEAFWNNPPVAAQPSAAAAFYSDGGAVVR